MTRSHRTPSGSLLAGLLPALCLTVAAPAPALGQEVVEHEEPDPLDGLVAFSPLGLDEALAAAKEQGKIVMADFYADWCVPCHKLDRTTWRHKDVVAWLQANAIAIKIDGEALFSQKQRYDVHAFPTMVFIRPNGAKIDMHVGYLDAVDWLDMANKTLFGKTTIELAKEAVEAAPDDPMMHRDYAEKLAQRYRYHDALAEYLWCLDEGVAHNPGFAAYRDSFLMSEIATLGQRFPLALQALKDRSKIAEEKLLAGEGTPQTAAYVAALNRAAGQGAETYRIWNRIRENADLDDALADAMFEEVFDVLLEEQRYDAIAGSVGDVFARIDERIQTYWMNSQSMGEEVDEELATILREAVVKDGARYYEVMLGAKKPDVAAQIVDKLLAFQDSGTTYAALIGRAIRAGDFAAARALGERGLAELSRGQHGSIKRALRKLPASEQ